ncbi:MAG: divergent PAP2 family protein [Oscillospiraceae bacterium]|nr:divergent PAP2 family protein [Oscillospiraceae bacterium]
MDWILEFFRNPFLIAGVGGWLVAQVVKTIIHAIIHKKIDWERLVGDGGMPSGHSATVTAVCTMSLMRYGPGSYEFAISAILALIVCHDAMGVRLQAGKHAVILNEIVEAFNALGEDKLPVNKLKEFVGHTPIQVIAGVLLGIAVALLMYFLWF